MSEIYLSVEQVAELLHTTNASIYVKVSRGQLPGVRKIGRRLLFNKASLIDWIEGDCSICRGGSS